LPDDNNVYIMRQKGDMLWQILKENRFILMKSVIGH